jgi:hypothetical protein
MFSFIGRGICTSPCSQTLQPDGRSNERGRRWKREDDVQLYNSVERSEESTWLTGYYTVYFFVGCILGGANWYNYIPASIVALIGLSYVALEFVPSIEPPANMRYVASIPSARQDILQNGH